MGGEERSQRVEAAGGAREWAGDRERERERERLSCEDLGRLIEGLMALKAQSKTEE